MKVPRIAHRFLAAAGITAAFLVVAAAAPATPGNGNGAVKIVVGNQPFDVGPQSCGFPIHVGVVSDKEYVIHDTVLADGTEIQRITGKLVMSFTNTNTGKTIVQNVSGPATLTFGADGSFVFDGQGSSVNFFGPASQASVGVPGLLFTTGHLVFTAGPVGPLVSLSLSGNATDGCALLS